MDSTAHLTSLKLFLLPDYLLTCYLKLDVISVLNVAQKHSFNWRNSRYFASFCWWKSGEAFFVVPGLPILCMNHPGLTYNVVE